MGDAAAGGRVALITQWTRRKLSLAGSAAALATWSGWGSGLGSEAVPNRADEKWRIINCLRRLPRSSVRRASYRGGASEHAAVVTTRLERRHIVSLWRVRLAYSLHGARCAASTAHVCAARSRTDHIADESSTLR